MATRKKKGFFSSLAFPSCCSLRVFISSCPEAACFLRLISRSSEVLKSLYSTSISSWKPAISKPHLLQFLFPVTSVPHLGHFIVYLHYYRISDVICNMKKGGYKSPAFPVQLSTGLLMLFPWIFAGLNQFYVSSPQPPASHELNSLYTLHSSDDRAVSEFLPGLYPSLFLCAALRRRSNPSCLKEELSNCPDSPGEKAGSSKKGMNASSRACGKAKIRI